MTRREAATAFLFVLVVGASAAIHWTTRQRLELEIAALRLELEDARECLSLYQNAHATCEHVELRKD